MSYSGGHIKDIPTPHRRKFPGDARRRVSVSIAVYDMAGGHHYRVSLEEEANPIWNPLTHAQANPDWKEIQGTEHGNSVVGWQQAWDDEEAEGRAFYSGGLDFLYQVEDFINSTWSENFSDETHYLSTRYSDEEVTAKELVREWRELYADIERANRYYYERDGD